MVPIYYTYVIEADATLTAAHTWSRLCCSADLYLQFQTAVGKTRRDEVENIINNTYTQLVHSLDTFLCSNLSFYTADTEDIKYLNKKYVIMQHRKTCSLAHNMPFINSDYYKVFFFQLYSFLRHFTQSFNAFSCTPVFLRMKENTINRYGASKHCTGGWRVY